MAKRKTSAYDGVTQHLITKLQESGVDVGSVREILQLGLVSMVDQVKSPGFLDYLSSFRILTNSARSETHICKGGEIWMVVFRDQEDSCLNEESSEVSASHELPKLPSVSAIVAHGVEVEEW